MHTPLQNYKQIRRYGRREKESSVFLREEVLA